MAELRAKVPILRTEDRLARQLAPVEAQVAVDPPAGASPRVTSWSSDRAASIAKAYEAATRSIALGPSESWAWTALGVCKIFFRDHGAAVADIRRALALDPNSAIAYGALAIAHGFAGEAAAAFEAVSSARRLSPADPREAIWLNGECLGYIALGRHREALDAARRMTELRADYPSGYRILAASAAELGLDDLARAAIARLLELMPGHRLEDVPAMVPFRDPEVADRYVRALARAGLPGTIPEAEGRT